MIFHGDTAHHIEHKLGSVNQDALHNALAKRGMASERKDIAKVLTGEHRAGWNQAKLRDVVEALQEVGLAKGEKSASEMVLRASRDAQAAANPGLSAGAVKARLKGIAVERRAEAETEESAEHMGILDRMRGDMGRANKSDHKPGTDNPDEPANKTVRQIREQMSQDLKLRPHLDIPKEPPFQS